MTVTIAFVTGNPTKFDFVVRNITCPPGVLFERVKVPVHEIQASTVADVCLHKAMQAYEQLKQPVLVHDSGMLVAELNGFPGPYTNDLIRTVGADRLFEIASRFSDPSLIFEDCLTFVDESGQAHLFTSNSAHLFRFATRKAHNIDTAMPLNGIVAFTDEPEKPFSEIEDFPDFYKRRIQQESIYTCWQQFSDFLAQHYNHRMK